MEKTIIKQDSVKPVLIYKDPKTGLQITRTIERNIAIVGRSSKADISIDYDKLSRNHFMIYKESGLYKIKDLDSTNGIIVNGKKVKISVLGNNAEIRVSDLNFKFVITNQDFDRSSINNIMAPNFEKITVEKASSIKLTITNNKLMLFSLVLASLLMILFFMEDDNANYVKTNTSQKNIVKINTMESEIQKAKLSINEQKKAMLSYKLAEHHFKSGSYDLALKAMKKYLDLVPDSDLAPAFIANCEEAIKRTSNIDKKLKEMQEEEKKRETIQALLKQAKDCMLDAKYDCAIDVYEKILEIDEYNEEANTGILKADNLLAELDKDTINEKDESIEKDEIKEDQHIDYDKEWDIKVKQMQLSYENKDYVRAYEIAKSILKEKAETTGYNNQSEASKIKNKVSSYYNAIFRKKMRKAKLLEDSDAKLEAVKIYKSVLRRFPYHRPARIALSKIYKFYHQKAKKLYKEALISYNYQDLDTAKANLKRVIKILPKNDPYYRKAKSLLRKIKKQEEM